MIIRRKPSLFGVAIGLCCAYVEVLPSIARAQAVETALSKLPSGSGNPRPVFARQELQAFAALVGEPESVVSQRLAASPDLLPFAAAAAEVRMERRSSGKVMTIAGFTVLGVGTVVGLAMVFSGIGAKCTNDGCSSDDGRIQLGLLTAALSSGVGLALGIPGIVRMARQSEIETEAAARYRSASLVAVSLGSTGSAQIQRGTLGTSFRLPLLAFVF
jgi:hypothetical protein